jgi:hypothetical protein
MILKNKVIYSEEQMKLVNIFQVLAEGYIKWHRLCAVLWAITIGG